MRPDQRTERRENPFAVVRTVTGYVHLADVQYHEGYTIFVAKRCVNELHEMALVAEAVIHAFRPRKLNYELLGNGAPHLHWHLFPRHADDPRRRGPVWEDPSFLHALEAGVTSTPEQLAEPRTRLGSALDATGISIERRFG